MNCNQTLYQEGTHLKIRDWTTSTLQQAKKTPKTRTTIVLKSKEEAAAVHLLAADFQTGEVALAAGTASPPTVPCSCEGMPTCSVRSKHSPTVCLICDCPDTISLYTQWRGVAVWTCCTSDPRKRTTFQLSTVIPRVWTAPGTQRSLLLPWQRDQRISPICLRGFLAVSVQHALLYWGFKFIFKFWGVCRKMLQPNLAIREDQSTRRWKVQNGLKIQVFLSHYFSFPH